MTSLAVRRSCAWLMAIAAALSFSGCSGEKRLEKFMVSGAVTLDDEAIKDGYIVFYPIDSGHDADSATISGGRYEMRATAGAKRVEITASRPIVPEKIGPLGGPEMEQYVPAKFNQKSDLTARVEKNDTNTVNFELKSK